MNTEEIEVQETEYGNWRKFEIDEDETIVVEAGYKPFNELLEEEFIELENLQNSECFPGISTGFESLDKVMAGLKKNDLVVIGGQPASGKTALALSIMLNVAVDHHLPVLYISLESSALELSKRIIRMRSGISNEKLYGISKLEPSEWMQLESKMKGVENAPIFIEERPNLTIGHIRNIVRTQIEKNGIRLVIIDYIQLIKGRVDNRINREQEMSSISRELKSLAKECQVPIVAISSLSRQLSNRQNTHSNSRPQISDLRDSGSIEFEADVILLLYPQICFGLSDDDFDRDRMTLIIAKNRDGECCDIDLKYDWRELRISEFEEGFGLYGSRISSESAMNVEDFDESNSPF